MQPPAEDEVEITVFGKGKGECTVVHLLDGKWMIVDSFERAPDQPVAEWYLDEMAVSTEDVVALVITHFDDDHYRGIRRLYDRYQNAVLVYTSALGRSQFTDVLAQGRIVSDVLEELAGTLQHARGRKLPDGLSARSESAGVGHPVYSNGNRIVRALSPTSAAVDRSMEEVVTALDNGWNAVRTRLRKDNLCSIALHLSLDGIDALIGGDLENEPAEFGWPAVLADRRHETLGKAGVVKAPHHGSDTADHRDSWEELTDGNPEIVVSPFNSSHLPTHEDVLRLRLLGREVWLTAPSTDGRPHERAEDIEEGTPRAAQNVGWVRARRCVGQPEWAVEPFMAASRALVPAGADRDATAEAAQAAYTATPPEPGPAAPEE